MLLVNANGAPVATSKLKALLSRAAAAPPQSLPEVLQLSVLLGAAFFDDQQTVQRRAEQTREALAGQTSPQDTAVQPEGPGEAGPARN